MAILNKRKKELSRVYNKSKFGNSRRKTLLKNKIEKIDQEIFKLASKELNILGIRNKGIETLLKKKNNWIPLNDKLTLLVNGIRSAQKEMPYLKKNKFSFLNRLIDSQKDLAGVYKNIHHTAYDWKGKRFRRIEKHLQPVKINKILLSLPIVNKTNWAKLSPKQKQKLTQDRIYLQALIDHPETYPDIREKAGRKLEKLHQFMRADIEKRHSYIIAV